ncbi:F0F1 ATP synthase subunit delta [methane-oxidizing endosymbiont of Gigantopelta aegis]|uniref:F0F1 ATP synthase subunit delta n=1 Tax=methane-oxidizing endosymbiont of Gigantopelta aegis TaxID=2794938 RepID=UPI0018DC2BCE|nr:F0F1 ATP synthase subunit delta [methane-oxidizing endosymbiont of Gigantopelta aegis]
MTELSTLARPYAQAAFKRAKEVGAAGVWSDSLAFLAQVMQDKALQAVVDNPRVEKERLLQLMLDISKGYIHDEAENFLKILIENDRLKLIPQISELYEQYKAEDEGYINVDLYSAYPITKDEQKKFVTSLEKLLSKKVNATVKVDKTLIGGIVAKAGDKVIDSSISGQLHQLEKRL